MYYNTQTKLAQSNHTSATHMDGHHPHGGSAYGYTAQNCQEKTSNLKHRRSEKDSEDAARS